MARRAALALLLGLVVGCTSIPAKSASSGAGDEEAVRALEAARGEALLRADLDALSDMIADDFVEVSRFGLARTKADNMRDIASGDLRLLTVKCEDMTVRLYGDVAVLVAVADNTGTFRGVPFSGRIRYTRVFVRRNDRWQAVAMQQTMLQQ
jgi:ketosteroid isomerase-like protein